MKEIKGETRNLRALLGNSRFGLDYYQREYAWEKKQIDDLLNDLCSQFLDDYDPNHARNKVNDYGHYFLGTTIISNRDGMKFLIDGQQRLTSLTLLLIHLYHHLDFGMQKEEIGRLVFSYQTGGEASFRLDIEERNECMNSLLEGNPIEEEKQPKSVVNILRRYQDIAEGLDDEIDGKALPYFADWLIENVYIIEITSYSDNDAYTVFETMNDRGLSLTPTQMLKSYLLANVEDIGVRNSANQVWRTLIDEFQEAGKDEDADAIKAWLRSQYAESIRERTKGAKPQDFDLIATEFHRWVREHGETIGLTRSTAFAKFIEEDFAFYGRWYLNLREAAQKFDRRFDCVYFNAKNKFTLQYPILLAALDKFDSRATVEQKLRIVSAFLDILLARRIWNRDSTNYNTMQYYAFNLITKIRRKGTYELIELLSDQLASEGDEAFSSSDSSRFGLRSRNGPQIRLILARMTDFIETASGLGSRCEEYMGYEIEHILSNKFEDHDDFDERGEFHEYRNRLGGLLLLPPGFNRSFGGDSYEKKLPHYYGQNLLAQSLNRQAYDRNPEFLHFREETQLDFKPHDKFDKEDLESRHRLYQAIAAQVWHPSRLRQVLDE